jgi:hypothetical protein
MVPMPDQFAVTIHLSDSVIGDLLLLTLLINKAEAKTVIRYKIQRCE